MNEEGYNHFAGSINIEDVGKVSYTGYERDCYIDPDQKWKGHKHYFLVESCVWLIHEVEPRKMHGFAATLEEALERMKRLILVCKVFSECRHFFPERTLNETLNSREYSEGLRKYGLLE
jgi:hypothetical protein